MKYNPYYWILQKKIEFVCCDNVDFDFIKINYCCKNCGARWIIKEDL